MDGDALDYGTRHQHFVSNHSGTRAEEILLISVVPPLSVALQAFVTIMFQLSGHGMGLGLLDFTLVSWPLLLCLTCCSEPHMYLLLCGLVILAIVVFAFLSARGKNAREVKVTKQHLLAQVICRKGRLPFLTNFRAAILLTTAICILAVDFPVFPRRFAKTETFGFGLMDLGVGSFIFAAGLVSQESRKGLDATSSRLRYAKKTMIQTVPLLILGLLRLISVKATGYHEHVTEYGVHWNFFFTMAFTKILATFFFMAAPVSLSWTSAVLLALLHEVCLSQGLSTWVLSGGNQDRHDLISANKEGLTSLPGYLAIYLAGVSWGSQLQQLGNTFKDSYDQAKKLVAWSLLMWMSLAYSKLGMAMMPSRRLSNWAFFNWMVAHNVTVMALFLISDLFVVRYCDLNANAGSKAVKAKRKSKKDVHDTTRKSVTNTPGGSEIEYVSSTRIPKSFAAINFNGLAYFLLANVLTGLVNFFVPTMDTSACPAVIILGVYLITLHIVALFCYNCNMQLKAW